MAGYQSRLIPIVCCLLVAILAPSRTSAGPPVTGVEGPHHNIPGHSPNSCGACHDIVGGPTGPDAVRRPTETCLGCHTDGTPYPGRSRATAAANHDWLVMNSAKFVFGDFGARWFQSEDDQEIHCTTCHDPHRTFDPTRGTTQNVKYIRAHTDDYQIDNNRVVWRPAKDLKVIDLTGPVPVQIVKQIDHDIVYRGTGDLANGDENFTADICTTCHTMTNHHRNDGAAPGGQSHYDGEKCVLCHTHKAGLQQSVCDGG